MRFLEIIAKLLIPLAVTSCALLPGRGASPAHDHARVGDSAAAAAARPPERVTLVKMISWAEPAPE
ncbi:MAG: hypothetical protein ACREQY_21115, partial [Candidatus Binatia bacterium]